ncbi:hypothetical protein B0H14DRAFT_2612966 [Mycena olivaceomarginata]|nr:hypothetical protein B0H14DRAFT_2612966 [Mycena olivaceomarginata]
MQLLKVVHLVAIACAMHVLASLMDTRSNATSRDVAYLIMIGTDSEGSTWAWISGASACTATEIHYGRDGGNFCGIHFYLSTQPGDFVFNGCGGPLWVDRDNYFYANCNYYSEAPQCVDSHTCGCGSSVLESDGAAIGPRYKALAPVQVEAVLEGSTVYRVYFSVGIPSPSLAISDAANWNS